jgi:hypothetical protein
MIVSCLLIKCCKYFVFWSLSSAVFTAVLIMSSMIPLTILSLDTDETVRKLSIEFSVALSSIQPEHSVNDFDTQSAFNRWWTTDSIHIIQLPLRSACYLRTKLENWWNKALTFPGNYSIGEGNTINKSTSISSLLLNASCRLIKLLKRYRSSTFVYIQNISWIDSPL